MTNDDVKGVAGTSDSEEDRSLSGMIEWLSMTSRSMKNLRYDPIYTVRQTIPLTSLPDAGLDLTDRADLLAAEERGLG